MPAKPKRPAKPAKGKTVATLRHDAKRKNLPTVEYESLMRQEEKSPIEVAYERRNRDLDPQFVWRGKDDADWSDLVVPAPPLYIQEKVHPKVLIDDLLRQSKARAQATAPQIDLFSDFNGLPKDARATEFYQHDANWTNRMILGDSLQVMASLAEREGLRGKVQCIYLDPPYGIKFNSNFQWSTTSRDVKDGNADHITREPEQVKAFRDTWRDGIHSYLTYLRDRLTVARDLLADSGSIFVQIGDENVHRVRGVMDEVFGDTNFVSLVTIRKLTGVDSTLLPATTDYVLFYGKDVTRTKYRAMLVQRDALDEGSRRYDQLLLSDGHSRPLTANEKDLKASLPDGANRYQLASLTSDEYRPDTTVAIQVAGERFHPGEAAHWKTSVSGVERLVAAGRIQKTSGGTIRYRRMLDDFPATQLGNLWYDISGSVQSRSDPKIYVVQSSTALIQRCILMTTDPGDLVLAGGG